MRHGRLLVLLLVALVLCGCARRQAYVYAPPSPYVQAPVAPVAYTASVPVGAPEQPYLLDSGDRVRVQVFGQDGITGSYIVDAAGFISISLIGPVPARGLTPADLAAAVTDRLRQGYIRQPHVSVEVEAHRPFFILGEVNAPGQYPYVANMTVETAVAIAGGYSPRAYKRDARITRNVNGQITRGKVPLNFPLRPGDTITVTERWF